MFDFDHPNKAILPLWQLMERYGFIREQMDWSHPARLLPAGRLVSARTQLWHDVTMVRG